MPLSGAKPVAQPTTQNWFSPFGSISASSPLRVDNAMGTLNTRWAPRKDRLWPLGRQLSQSFPMDEQRNAIMKVMKEVDETIQKQDKSCIDQATGVHLPAKQSWSLNHAGPTTPPGFDVAPYADDVTKCNMMTLPSIMKVCSSLPCKCCQCRLAMLLPIGKTRTLSCHAALKHISSTWSYWLANDEKIHCSCSSWL
jgi:hypothetical protein